MAAKVCSLYYTCSLTKSSSRLISKLSSVPELTTTTCFGRTGFGLIPEIYYAIGLPTKAGVRLNKKIKMTLKYKNTGFPTSCFLR